MKTATRMSPSTVTTTLVSSTGSQLSEQRRPDLEQRQREADRDREREDDLAAGDLGDDVAVVVLLTRRDVRGDREGRKPIASDSPRR